MVEFLDVFEGLIGFLSALILYFITIGIDKKRKNNDFKQLKLGLKNAIIQDLQLNKSKVHQLHNESKSKYIPYYNLNPDYDLYLKFNTYLDFTTDKDQKIDAKRSET